MYCGDEVSALVGDVGACVSKFGYAGEDTPKAVFPSTVGELLPEEVARLTKANAGGGEVRRWSVGSVALPVRRDGLVMRSPLNEQTGLVQNWDALEQVWEHGFSELRSNPREHPVLCSEASWSVNDGGLIVNKMSLHTDASHRPPATPFARIQQPQIHLIGRLPCNASRSSSYFLRRSRFPPSL